MDSSKEEEHKTAKRRRLELEDENSSVVMESEMNVTELPNEILLKIMGYISTYDILRNLAPVSRKFHRLSRGKNLFKKIQLKTNDKAITGGFATTRIVEMTKEQEEKYCRDFFQVINRSKKLTYLSLDLREITHLGFGPNRKILEKLFSNKQPIILQRILSENQSLAEHCLNPTLALKTFGKFISQFKSLKEVHLTWRPLRLQNQYGWVSLYGMHIHVPHLWPHRGLYPNRVSDVSSVENFLEKITEDLPNIERIFLALDLDHSITSYDRIRKQLFMSRNVVITIKNQLYQQTALSYIG